MHGALNVGLRGRELVEVMVQSSIYTGFPAAVVVVNAIEIAREVFRKRETKKVRQTNNNKKDLVFSSNPFFLVRIG